MSRLFLAGLALALASGLVAQEDLPQPSGDDQQRPPAGLQPTGKSDRQKVEAQISKMQEQQRKMNEKRMEALRQSNPEGYREIQEALERRKKIDKVLLKSQQRELTEEEAEKELYPLIKKELRYELDGLDGKIARLEKRLTFLKQIKRNPDVLIRRRIEELLGKRMPDPAEFVH